MIINENDLHFMKLAYAEAVKAFEKDEVPVGAVIVSNSKVIGRGHNLSETLNDATAHAEMLSFTAATNHIGGKYLNDCTLFVTVEPCAMCAAAAFWVQLGRLVYATSDPKRGYTTISNKLLHPKTVVESGLMADECQKLMTDFFKKKRS
ncbi:MAG: nucleoside deaminase [Omnitrophica WOR_2 bacterium]|jgi:tRNA(adenine34) deaminase